MDTAMPTTTNKQRLLTQIFTTLKKRYEPADPEERPVLEQFLYALCREGAARAQADRAYRNLRELFFDWNEVRVSSPREIEESLGTISDAENRANRLISFLQEVFETTFSFDLEGLHKKGLKQAAKQLSRYQAANDYSIAWVVQHSLGGHAIPLDLPMLQILRRLGLIDEDQHDLEALRASLEHLIPKSRGPLFVELISALAHDPDLEHETSGPLHALLGNGSFPEENGTSTVGSERSSRPKPR
jgi:endonuclease-3